MGSGGMKRKNRKRLPKVGTSTERRYAQHEEQREVFHTGHGRGSSVTLNLASSDLIKGSCNGRESMRLAMSSTNR